MVLSIYYAAAIDNCPDKGKKQLEQFKQIIGKYPIDLKGAGIGDSPIIKLDSSVHVKGVITAHDLKELRMCDILLVVLDSSSQAVATFMELEYARQLGLYIIILILSKKEEFCLACAGDRDEWKKKCTICHGTGKILMPMENKSIFLQTFANAIIYDIHDLEYILKEITTVEAE